MTTRAASPSFKRRSSGSDFSSHPRHDSEHPATDLRRFAVMLNAQWQVRVVDLRHVTRPVQVGETNRTSRQPPNSHINSSLAMGSLTSP
ncbi:hypothetical protein PISMIDRAFT_482600 [Pisolithus microcarpus 441]|uniref:Uncharacterized protein n=1 Tax=Pisolithus microcarpus 441 TaxID=765257 RepID=A0A0C9YWI9_9AGAM|nr:hypothetical protein PISMIDRAFT_482600 [Pisolithus microcarpus 441]